MSVRWKKILYPCWFAFCPTESEFRKELRQSSDPDFPFPDTSGCCVEYTDKEGDRKTIVVINCDWEKDTATAMGVLVHECVHVVEAMIRVAQDDRPSEEFRAYMTQAVFCELLSDISEWRKKIGKS